MNRLLSAVSLKTTTTTKQQQQETVTILVVAAAATCCCCAAAAFVVIQRRRQTRKQNKTSSASATPPTLLELIQTRRSIFPKQYDSTASSHHDDKLPLSIIHSMLEAARWAPTHHLSEPWKFVVLSTDAARAQLGHYLSNQYQMKASESNSFSQAKFDKKFNSCMKADYIIAIFCKLNTQQQHANNPAVEEVCSVAAAVQNMLLVASSHRVGAYWSTSGIYDMSTPKLKTALGLVNPPELLKEFLLNHEDDNHHTTYLCLGWVFVGPYDSKKPWPQSRRKPCDVEYR